MFWWRRPPSWGDTWYRRYAKLWPHRLRIVAKLKIHFCETNKKKTWVLEFKFSVILLENKYITLISVLKSFNPLDDFNSQSIIDVTYPFVALNIHYKDYVSPHFMVVDLVKTPKSSSHKDTGVFLCWDLIVSSWSTHEHHRIYMQNVVQKSRQTV